MAVVKYYDSGTGAWKRLNVGTRVDEAGIPATEKGAANGVATLDSSGNIVQDVARPDGTALIPGYNFDADTNTGMYRIGADNIGFSTAGSLRASITSAGDVSIGSSTSPHSKLYVEGAITAGDASATSGSVMLRGRYSSTDATVIVGSKRSTGGVLLGYGVKASTTTNDAYLSTTSITIPRNLITVDGDIRCFSAGSQATAVDSEVTLTERMRLTNSGRLGIGTVSPTGILDVQDNAGSLTSTPSVTAEFHRADGTYAPKLQISHSTLGSHINHTYASSASSLILSVASTELARLSQADVVVNEPGADINFRVESTASSHSLYVDGSTGNVGIRNTTPSQALDVVGNIEVTGKLLSGDGTAALPAITFSTDEDTGIFRNGANAIAISTGGVDRFRISSTQITPALPIRASDGSEASPHYSFGADPDSGITRTAADTVNIVTNGTTRLKVDNTEVTMAGQVTLPPTALTPLTGAVTIDFAGTAVRTQAALTGAVTYSGSNYAAGRSVTVRVLGGASVQNVSFDASWVFVGAKPTTLAAGKTAILTLTSFGTTAADVVAAWAVQE